jgi:hypothetical protein
LPPLPAPADNAAMLGDFLWIALQAVIVVAVSTAFSKIAKASLQKSIGLGVFFTGYEIALVGVIVGHIPSCFVGTIILFCGVFVFLATARPVRP